MGTRQIIVRFCDKCNKEILGRLTIHTCPVCNADICVSCQEKENARHQPREKKPKAKAEAESPTEVESDKPDISTFLIRTLSPGLGYTLSIGGFKITAETLKDGVIELLSTLGIDQAYIENAPDSEGRRTLLEILGPLKEER